MCHAGAIVSSQTHTHEVPKKIFLINQSIKRATHAAWFPQTVTTKIKKKSIIPPEITLFCRKHSPKFCDAGKKSEQYHLLLMSLRTFGASLGSSAPRHCITTRWVLAVQLMEFYWKQGSPLNFWLLLEILISDIFLCAPECVTRWIKFSEFFIAGGKTKKKKREAQKPAL